MMTNSPPHAFLADDDRIMRTLTAAQIEQLGHTTTSFDDGDELVAAALKNPNAVDYIILDRQMARIGGIEAMRELKANPTTAHIPAFLLTGSDLAEHKAEAKQAGAVGYLVKPTTPEELEKVLAQLS